MAVETIFDPRVIGERPYKQFYPELGRIEEFKNISNRILVLIWYYCNPSSPLVQGGLSNYDRIDKAIRLADPTEDKIQKNETHRMRALEFTDEFVKAVNRMSSMSYEARAMGNSMLSHFMTNFAEVSKLKPKDFVDSKGVVDYEKYARTAGTIMSNLTNLIKMAEEGFGVTKETSIIEEESLIARFHESRKQ